MSVARGTAINLVTRLAAVGLLLVITAFTARLGPDRQGMFALFTSVEGLLLALCSGFGIALARRVSHHGEAPRAMAGAVIVVCVGIGVVAAGALWIASSFGPPAYAPLGWLAIAAPVLLLAPNLAGLWLGEGRMAPMAGVSLAPPLLALLGLAVVLITQAPALELVLGAWVGAKVVVGIGVVVVLWRAARLAAPDFAGLRSQWPFIATIGAANLIGLLNYRVGLFVIERWLGLSATGVYSIAVVVVELLWFVSGSLTQAVYGRIGTPDRARAAATTLRVVHLSVTALVLLSPLLWLAAHFVVPWALGEAYRASLPLLALLLPGVLLFGGASALSAYFTNHVGKPQVPARVAMLSLLLNGGLAVGLVPQFGMAGAALAASVSYIVAVLLLARSFATHAGLPLGQVLRPGPQLWADLRTLALRRGG